MSETVTCSVRETEAGSVATLTIDRETKLNALNPALVEATRQAIERESRAHRVIVLTGAGDRSFIGGADIGHMAKLDPVTGKLDLGVAAPQAEDLPIAQQLCAVPSPIPELPRGIGFEYGLIEQRVKIAGADISPSGPKHAVFDFEADIGDRAANRCQVRPIRYICGQGMRRDHMGLAGAIVIDQPGLRHLFEPVADFLGEQEVLAGGDRLPQLTQGEATRSGSAGQLLQGDKGQVDPRDRVLLHVIQERIHILAQLGLQPIYHIEKNPLRWMDEILNGVEHANFFENRATEYSRAATQGSWDEAFD